MNLIEDARLNQSIGLVPHSSYAFTNSNFCVGAARELIPECLNRDTWTKRNALVKAVADMHIARGGLRGDANPVGTVKAAISFLLETGVVVNRAEDRGYYTLSNSRAARSFRDEKRRRSTRLKRDLKVERTIGSGEQSVYVYLNDNDRLLAFLKGRKAIECKTGFTTKGDARERVSDQIGTAMSRFPTIALVIKTADGAKLEKNIHVVLELADCIYPERCGSEWFLTSVEMIEFIWFELIANRKTHKEIADAARMKLGNYTLYEKIMKRLNLLKMLIIGGCR